MRSTFHSTASQASSSSANSLSMFPSTTLTTANTSDMLLAYIAINRIFRNVRSSSVNIINQRTVKEFASVFGEMLVIF